jgi:hypothetical protein
LEFSLQGHWRLIISSRLQSGAEKEKEKEKKKKS